MKIKLKEVTKTVPLLVDPEPGWMALVNHGANQEPFNSLKSETGKRSDAMAKGKGAKRDSVLTRLNFSKEQYKDEAAVQKFLDDNNITDTEIMDDGDVFAAKSTTAELSKLNKAVSTTTKHAGVTAFIAEPKEDDGENEDGDEGEDGTEAGGEGPKDDVTADEGEPAKKGATKAKLVDGKTVTTKADDDKEGDEETDTELRFPANKYDYWGAMMSNEGSLLGVLKDGTDYDGLPPGMDEVISAVYFSTGNVLSDSASIDEKRTKVAQIGEDFAALTMGLFELFEQATEDSTKSANIERKAKAAAFVKSFSESVTRAAKGGDNVIAQPATSTKGGGVTIDIADATDETEEDKLAALIGKHVAPIMERLEKSEKANEALTAQLARSTSRRSDQSIIDDLTDTDDEDDTSEPTPAQKQAQADLAAVFGIRPRANAG